MKQGVFVVIFAIILDVISVETGSKMLQKKFLLDGHDNTCDFNTNTLCAWRNVRDLKAGEVSDDFDWALYSGSTPTDDTGPSVDHTTGTDKGTYAFIESSAPRVLGERAWMESPEIQAPGQSVVCFRFWYHKFGEKMGNLSVYQHQHGPRPGNLVWSDVTEHGDRWLSAQVPLLANMNFRIILEGVIGDGFLGDIAVDDVSVGNEYCLVAPPEASRSNVTPSPMTSVPSPVITSTASTTTHTPPNTTDLNLCSSNPCLHGNCFSGSADYFCQCEQGWQGKHCDQHECFAGEHTGKVANTTCDEIGRQYRGLCEGSGVKRQCCKACANYGTLVTSMTDIDAQCKVKHGAGSSFCRGAKTYDNIAFGDIVCSKMFCTDLDNSNLCTGFIADDKTACGNKKWCINGSCVHNDLAPAVPDDCPWSQDDPDFRLDTGQTCTDVALPANHYLCYNADVSKRCCNTCRKYKTNTPGCEYGDQNPSSCAPYFPTKPYMCYTSPNDQICCGSCAKYRNSSNVGCEYGDPNVASCASYFPNRKDICYTASNLATCCSSCAKARNVNLAGCEYGDHLSGCQQSSCSRYDAKTRQGCCETCHSSAPIVG